MYPIDTCRFPTVSQQAAQPAAIIRLGWRNSPGLPTHNMVAPVPDVVLAYQHLPIQNDLTVGKYRVYIPYMEYLKTWCPTPHRPKTTTRFIQDHHRDGCVVPITGKLSLDQRISTGCHHWFFDQLSRCIFALSFVSGAHMCPLLMVLGPLLMVVRYATQPVARGQETTQRSGSLVSWIWQDKPVMNHH